MKNAEKRQSKINEETYKANVTNQRRTAVANPNDVYRTQNR